MIRDSRKVEEVSSSSDPTFGHDDDIQNNHNDKQAVADLQAEEQQCQKDEAELDFILQQMWTHYELSAAKMKAMSDVSFQQLLGSLPDEVLDMNVADFLEIAESQPDSQIA